MINTLRESYLHRIFRDLMLKTNLPRNLNKAHYDVVPTCQDILSNIFLEHLFLSKCGQYKWGYGPPIHHTRQNYLFSPSEENLRHKGTGWGSTKSAAANPRSSVFQITSFMCQILVVERTVMKASFRYF